MFFSLSLPLPCFPSLLCNLYPSCIADREIGRDDENIFSVIGRGVIISLPSPCLFSPPFLRAAVFRSFLLKGIEVARCHDIATLIVSCPPPCTLSHPPSLPFPLSDSPLPLPCFLAGVKLGNSDCVSPERSKSMTLPVCHTLSLPVPSPFFYLFCLPHGPRPFSPARTKTKRIVMERHTLRHGGRRPACPVSSTPSPFSPSLLYSLCAPWCIEVYAIRTFPSPTGGRFRDIPCSPASSSFLLEPP